MLSGPAIPERPGKNRSIGAMAWTADGRTLVTADNGGPQFEGLGFQVWDIATGTEKYHFRGGGAGVWSTWGLVLSPDGRWMASFGSSSSRNPSR